MKRTYSFSSDVRPASAPVIGGKGSQVLFFCAVIPLALILLPFFKLYELFTESALPQILRKVWRSIYLFLVFLVLIVLVLFTGAAVYFGGKRAKKEARIPAAAGSLRRWVSSLLGEKIQLPRFARQATAAGAAVAVAITPASAPVPTISSSQVKTPASQTHEGE